MTSSYARFYNCFLLSILCPRRYSLLPTISFSLLPMAPSLVSHRARPRRPSPTIRGTPPRPAMSPAPLLTRPRGSPLPGAPPSPLPDLTRWRPNLASLHRASGPSPIVHDSPPWPAGPPFPPSDPQGGGRIRRVSTAPSAPPRCPSLPTVGSSEEGDKAASSGRQVMVDTVGRVWLSPAHPIFLFYLFFSASQ